ncbi:DUF4762 domain-containing protein [Klebsiella sp. BIGb0407]|uniref:DUF4762 domain-containing protein n=1 Tax=Klebsiella sp. BIGb0407 TaxID=2940603 RepID=UPI002169B17E|nr:DUF4762 domain-containing protein [Klebsiella sp. BIGb0407]MCS3430275.1 hypothetical protein [Klebsiella sp. BIGb0407]
MKKLSMVEAASIIGGTCKDTCTSSYELVGVGGANSCKEVTTCVDKHGNSTVTMKNAAKGMCVIPN